MCECYSRRRLIYGLRADVRGRDDGLMMFMSGRRTINTRLVLIDNYSWPAATGGGNPAYDDAATSPAMTPGYAFPTASAAHRSVAALGLQL